MATTASCPPLSTTSLGLLPAVLAPLAACWHPHLPGPLLPQWRTGYCRKLLQCAHSALVGAQVSHWARNKAAGCWMVVARSIWWELGGSTHAKCSVVLDVGQLFKMPFVVLLSDSSRNCEACYIYCILLMYWCAVPCLTRRIVVNKVGEI